MYDIICIFLQRRNDIEDFLVSMNVDIYGNSPDTPSQDLLNLMMRLSLEYNKPAVVEFSLIELRMPDQETAIAVRAFSAYGGQVKDSPKRKRKLVSALFSSVLLTRAWNTQNPQHGYINNA